MKRDFGLVRHGALKHLGAAAAIFATGFAAPALASSETVNAQYVYNSSLAATCASCHGTNGVSVAGNRVPLINNLTHQEIAQRMIEYKEDKRPGTIMPQLAKGYTNEQIEIIAQVLGKK